MAKCYEELTITILVFKEEIVRTSYYIEDDFDDFNE